MLVETNWQGKMAFESGNEEGNTFMMDADEAVGGEGKGVSPMEALLGAMTGCMSMDVTAFLRRFVRNGQVQQMRMEANGTQNETHPRYFTDIVVTFYLDGNVPAERAWNAFRKSESHYCPVRNSMKSNVTLKLILNGEEIPEVR